MIISVIDSSDANPETLLLAEIDGAFGTLSELGHALGDGIPVVGLETWVLARNGRLDQGIIVAKSPIDAGDKVLASAAMSHKEKETVRPTSRSR